MFFFSSLSQSLSYLVWRMSCSLWRISQWDWSLESVWIIFGLDRRVSHWDECCLVLFGDILFWIGMSRAQYERCLVQIWCLLTWIGDSLPQIADFPSQLAESLTQSGVSICQLADCLSGPRYSPSRLRLSPRHYLFQCRDSVSWEGHSPFQLRDTLFLFGDTLKFRDSLSLWDGTE